MKTFNHCFQTLFNTIFELFIPSICPCCEHEALHAAKETFCPHCLKTFPHIKPPYCQSCGGSIDTACQMCSSCLRRGAQPWALGITLFEHNQSIRILIHKMKYRKRIDLTRAFAFLMQKKVNDFPEKIDYIIPMPMPAWRRFLRGYNHAHLLAKWLSFYTHIPMVDVLTRHPFTRTQVTRDRASRFRALKRVFKLKNPEKIKGKNVLIIDDVFTTGATLTAASKIIQKTNVNRIDVMTISRR